jgi:hypothetical protein
MNAIAYVNSASEWFWNDDFWLPPNLTWADINPETTPTPHINYCNFCDLGYPLLMAWVVLAIKFVVETKVFRAIGRSIGMQENAADKKMPPTNDVLESEFKSGRRLDHTAIVRLAGQLDMPDRKVERWLRQRAAVGKPSKLDKFCECAFKTLYYFVLYTFSWFVLWDKKWFWSIKDCWFAFPHHSVTDDVWWYYMIELSYYWSCIISQFFDAKRKDFWEMFLHHVATIALLALSWSTNLFKIGTLVLWVHDMSDVFLESAKMFKYAGWNGISDLLFYSFAISWVVTRLGFLPTWIIYSITVEAPNFIQYYPAYNVFSLLLSILVILHLFWAYFIFKVAYVAMLTPDGKIERDLRSESDSD